MVAKILRSLTDRATDPFFLLSFLDPGQLNLERFYYQF